MKFKLIKSDDKILPINNIKYRINELDKIKKELSESKNKLDEKFNKEFKKYWKRFDPFFREKKVVPILGNTNNVTNAWLKCYEILIYFDLIPKNTNDEFLHFDNAAFPGSFVLATHHLVKTKYKDLNYNWVASSLHDINESNKHPLEDSYGLYKNYKDKWLMSETNNGDVLLRKNQEDFYNKLNNKVSLYTSDLGFDVSSDYNNQELLQLPANIGQIISGLLTLKKGGCFITKQYMNFEPITISIIYATSQFFEEFYICKPVTSREANSETYLVGKGFKKPVDLNHPYIIAMLDRIENDLEKPLFKKSNYPKNFIKDIVDISDTIFGDQIKKLNFSVEQVELSIKNATDNINLNPIVTKYNESINAEIENWYSKYNILPISNNDKLNTSRKF